MLSLKVIRLKKIWRFKKSQETNEDEKTGKGMSLGMDDLGINSIDTAIDSISIDTDAGADVT